MFDESVLIVVKQFEWLQYTQIIYRYDIVQFFTYCVFAEYYEFIDHNLEIFVVNLQHFNNAVNYRFVHNTFSYNLLYTYNLVFNTHIFYDRVTFT